MPYLSVISGSGRTRMLVIDRRRPVVMRPPVANDLRIRCGKSSSRLIYDWRGLIVDRLPAANLSARRRRADVYSPVITQAGGSDVITAAEAGRRDRPDVGQYSPTSCSASGSCSAGRSVVIGARSTAK